MKTRPSFGIGGRGSEALLLVGAILTATYSSVATLGLLFTFAVIWIRRRPKLREATVIGLLLVATFIPLIRGQVSRHDGDWIRQRIEEDYAALWADLDAKAEEVAQQLPPLPIDGEGRLEAFQLLRSFTLGNASEVFTVQLLDPDGRAVAWSGKGLLHEPDAHGFAESGRDFRSGFGTVDLIVIKEVTDSARPWKVLAGRSISTHGSPEFLTRFGTSSESKWALADEGFEPRSEIETVRLPSTPVLLFESKLVELREVAPQSGGADGKRIPGFLGLMLFVVILVRNFETGRGGESVNGSGVGFDFSPRTYPLLLIAAGTMCRAFGLPWIEISLLIGAICIFGIGSQWRLRPGGEKTAIFLGMGIALFNIAVSFGLQILTGAVEHGTDVLASPRFATLRLTHLVFVLGLLRHITSDRKADDDEVSRWGLAALVFLILAATLHDHLAICAILLGLAGACSGLWLSRKGSQAGLARPIGMLLIAAVLSAVAWQTAYRSLWEGHLESELLDDLAPPTQSELQVIGNSLEEFFAQLDLESMVLVDPTTLDPEDLAFELWRVSPLAQVARLSSVVLVPTQGPQSSFSFGLPLTKDGDLDRSPQRWNDLELPGWDDALIRGRIPILVGEEPWGDLDYSLLLRPGFRLGSKRLHDFAAGLLRGGPTAMQPGEEFVGPAVFGIYSQQGHPEVVPWPQAEKLDFASVSVAGDLVQTPVGRARLYFKRGPEGIRALFLPMLSPWEALNRVGGHALGSVMIIGLIALLGFVLTTKIESIKEWALCNLRSYPKRLLMAYGILLLLPLLLLDLVVIRGLTTHLQEEQMATGQRALDSAQKILGEYILTLEPGFGVETAVDDELLIWLSRVLRHEVNIYWGSRLYASSKPELFAAGLLPRRIPGEIFSEIGLRGNDVSSRLNVLSKTRYVELYAPLKIPGVPMQRSQLVLSIPLLAQQEELARELADVRQEVALTTAIVALLMAAVGSVLTRNFTSPLMEIVKGTQRIATGARSLGLKPTELELATLVEAIDLMATRIAAGRESLLQEKAVVDRIVDNINSGIISLDSNNRVMLANRVAGDLLGVKVGEPIENALRQEDQFRSISKFLVHDAAQSHQKRVQVSVRPNERKEWNLIWVPLPGTGEPAGLLVIEDMTEVLEGQRLVAWAEMARMIAHEIKNPLTPIRLSTEHMRRVYFSDRSRFEELFERCTDNILAQVSELQQIAVEFSTFSRIPEITPKREQLDAVISRLVEGYREAESTGVEVTFSSEPDDVEAVVDARLLSRAVRNLIENALRISPQGGRVAVRLRQTDAAIHIEVEDDGPGLDADVLAKIFEPYFSTHASGTGLGLPIAKRIVEEHGGRIIAKNLQSGGLGVYITLPLA